MNDEDHDILKAVTLLKNMLIMIITIIIKDDIFR